MRVTAIQAETERNRQDRSARHAENRADGQGRRGYAAQFQPLARPQTPLWSENACSASSFRRTSPQTEGHMGNVGSYWDGRNLCLRHTCDDDWWRLPMDAQIRRGNITYLPAFEAPAGDRETVLAGIWSREFNMDRVGRNDDFFDLGGDSQKALELAMLIEEAFGASFESSEIIEHSTIASQAEFLDLQPVQTIPSWLTGVNKGGPKPPLFYVHGALGVTYLDRKFLEFMGPDQPIYFYRLPGLKDGEPILKSVEEIAETYADAMRKVHPVGPYRIAANCACSLIALEMSLLIEDAGESVDTLILVDPMPEVIQQFLGRGTVRKNKEFGFSGVVARLQNTIATLRFGTPKIGGDDDEWTAEIKNFTRKHHRSLKSTKKIHKVVQDGSAMGIESASLAGDAEMTKTLILLSRALSNYEPRRQRQSRYDLIVSQRLTYRLRDTIAEDAVLHRIAGGHSDVFERLVGDTVAAMKSALQGS